jgi:hypothetical protein
MMLTVAPGARHLGVAGTGARIDGGNSAIGEIVVDDDYTVVEWLEVTRARGAMTAGARVLAPNVVLQNLLLYDNSTGAAVAGAGGANFTIRNSMVYRNDRDGISGNLGGDSVQVHNCTIFGNGEQGIDGGASSFQVHNTISMSNSSADIDVMSDSSSPTCRRTTAPSDS